MLKRYVLWLATALSCCFFSAGVVGNNHFMPLAGQWECQILARAPDGTWESSGIASWRWEVLGDGDAVMDVWNTEETASSKVSAVSLRILDVPSGKWETTRTVSHAGSQTIQQFRTATETSDSVTLKGITGGMADLFQVVFYNIGNEAFDWSLKMHGDIFPHDSTEIRKQRCQRA